MLRESVVALSTLLLLSTACNGGPTTRSTTVRDSIGISIITSHEPLWSDAEQWRIEEEPFREIGVVDGDSVYQFYQVTGAARLSNGTVVTSDQTSNTVRFFEPSGEFIRAVGGSGEGPGEFRRLSQILKLVGDSILAYDDVLRRITLLSPQGTVLSMITLTRPGLEPLRDVYRLRDGRFVTRTGWSTAQVQPPFKPGLTRSETPVFIFNADGALADTLGMFPGYEMAISTIGDGVAVGSAPFGHTLAIAVDKDRVLVGTGERIEVLEMTPEGQAVRILRGPEVDLQLLASDLDRFVRARLEVVDLEARRATELRLEETPAPDRKAVFTRILSDVDENIWLSPYETYGFSERTWRVFDSAGRYLGEVAAPAGLRILDVGDDYVLGRWQDASQVEFIRLHALVKP